MVTIQAKCELCGTEADYPEDKAEVVTCTCGNMTLGYNELGYKQIKANDLKDISYIIAEPKSIEVQDE